MHSFKESVGVEIKLTTHLIKTYPSSAVSKFNLVRVDLVFLGVADSVRDVLGARSKEGEISMHLLLDCPNFQVLSEIL